VTPRSKPKALPHRTQRGTEGDQDQTDPQDASGELSAGATRDFSGGSAEVAKQEKPGPGTALRVEKSSEPRNAESNPGVESAKSIFLEVQQGRGWQITARYRHHPNRPGKAARARS